MSAVLAGFVMCSTDLRSVNVKRVILDICVVYLAVFVHLNLGHFSRWADVHLCQSQIKARKSGYIFCWSAVGQVATDWCQ